MIHYKFVIYNNYKNQYACNISSTSFFDALCRYKDKIFSKKTYFSLYSNSFYIAIVGLYSHKSGKFLPLDSPFVICSLEELRYMDVSPDVCAIIERYTCYNLFMKSFISLLPSIFSPPKPEGPCPWLEKRWNL